MNSKTYYLLTACTLLLMVLSPVFSVSAQKVSKSFVPAKTVSGVKAEPSESRLYTEKSSYLEGETVSASGGGFNKFEQVNVSVEQVGDGEQPNAVMATWIIFADETGTVNLDWQVPASGRFLIKTVGNESNLTIETDIICPVTVNGNPNCATLNASTNPDFRHITTNYGFKIDPPASMTTTFSNGTGRTLTGGATADTRNTVKTTMLNSKTFNWSSTKSITAVIVKGGSSANVYPYSPALKNHHGLTTVNSRNAISHIEFCYAVAGDPPPATITIIKDSQPNSTQTFNFSAIGQISQNFGLVDNGVAGPDRITFNNLTRFGADNAVTISEGSSSPFSLVAINCISEGGTNNNIINVPSRFVQIVLEPNECVTCTFVNAVTTAAYVSVGGRVATEEGRALGRVQVTIQNVNTMETQTVYTSSFGRYQFDNLVVGDYYIISVNSKKHLFQPAIQSFVLDDFRENVDFSAAAP